MEIDFNKMQGLVPAIIQDADTRQVLMLGYMNQQAYDLTVMTGKVTFWSRTRKTTWTKGETSGNVQTVRSIWLDCDADTILVKATPAGPACHTGNRTCSVCSLPEQVEIVRILDIIIEKENKAKQAAEAVLEQIDLLKKSILARAFRGEL